MAEMNKGLVSRRGDQRLKATEEKRPEIIDSV